MQELGLWCRHTILQLSSSTALFRWYRYRRHLNGAILSAILVSSKAMPVLGSEGSDWNLRVEAQVHGPLRQR